MRLILSKKTSDINFTGKNFFFGKTNTFIIIPVVILFNKISVNRNSNYHLFAYHLGWTAKCFYTYVQSVKFFWSGR